MTYVYSSEHAPLRDKSHISSYYPDPIDAMYYVRETKYEHNVNYGRPDPVSGGVPPPP